MTLSQVLIAIHTLISIVALVVGVFALRDLFRAQASSTSLSAFIVLAIATSVTGFLCPWHARARVSMSAFDGGGAVHQGEPLEIHWLETAAEGRAQDC